MAERLTPRDHKLFRAHIAKYRDQDPCPICHTHKWLVSGLEQAIGYDGGEPSLGAPAMPVVQVMCEECFYVRQFAWMPIQRTAGRNV